MLNPPPMITIDGEEYSINKYWNHFVKENGMAYNTFKNRYFSPFFKTLEECTNKNVNGRKKVTGKFKSENKYLDSVTGKMFTATEIFNMRKHKHITRPQIVAQLKTSKGDVQSAINYYQDPPEYYSEGSYWEGSVHEPPSLKKYKGFWFKPHLMFPPTPTGIKNHGVGY